MGTKKLVIFNSRWVGLAARRLKEPFRSSVLFHLRLRIICTETFLRQEIWRSIAQIKSFSDLLRLVSYGNSIKALKGTGCAQITLKLKHPNCQFMAWSRILTERLCALRGNSADCAGSEVVLLSGCLAGYFPWPGSVAWLFHRHALLSDTVPIA